MQSTATRLHDLATLPLAEGKRNSPKSCSTVYRLPLEKSVPAQRLGGLVLGCLVRATTGKSNVVVGMPLDCIDALTISCSNRGHEGARCRKKPNNDTRVASQGTAALLLLLRCCRAIAGAAPSKHPS